jgi:hypothetical protein
MARFHEGFAAERGAPVSVSTVAMLARAHAARVIQRLAERLLD